MRAYLPAVFIVCSAWACSDSAGSSPTRTDSGTSSQTDGTPGTDGGTTTTPVPKGQGMACKGAAPVCLKNTTLPASSPPLTPGTWSKISPPDVRFDLPNVFTQGLALDPCDASTLYLATDAFDVKEPEPSSKDV